MRNIWTIAKREYDNYFNGPLAYVVAFAVLFLLGIYFALIMFFSSQSAGMGGPAPESTPLNWLFVFLMIFLSPALTMRLLSDEARMGTLELLLTAPIRDFELVAGKWLGALMFIITLAAATLVYPIILNNFVQPSIDWRVIISSYIGLILVCSALLGLGVGISCHFHKSICGFLHHPRTILLPLVHGQPAGGNSATRRRGVQLSQPLHTLLSIHEQRNDQFGRYCLLCKSHCAGLVRRHYRN